MKCNNQKSCSINLIDTYRQIALGISWIIPRSLLLMIKMISLLMIILIKQVNEQKVKIMTSLQ